MQNHINPGMTHIAHLPICGEEDMKCTYHTLEIPELSNCR